MKRVRVRAASRVDLAGGSLDLWPIGLLVPGACTVNVAISLAVTVECTPTSRPGIEFASKDLLKAYTWRSGEPPGGLPLLEKICQACGVTEGWRVQTSSEVPPGSGLGGSSTLAAALVLALDAATGRQRTPQEAVGLCRDVEAANLGIPTGVQDFWPAMRGGVLCITYLPGGERVESLPLNLKEVASRLVVAYTGVSRLSARTNWELTRRFLDGVPQRWRVICEPRSSAATLTGAGPSWAGNGSFDGASPKASPRPSWRD